MNKIKAEITLTDEQIDNWLCGAFEGGSTYWCRGIKVKNNDYKGTKYASECVSRGGTIIVDDEYDADDSDRLFQIACFGEVIYG